MVEESGRRSTRKIIPSLKIIENQEVKAVIEKEK